MPANVEVPAESSAFGPEWLTSALELNHPGAVVGSVEVLDAHVGVTARHRLALHYSEGAGPETVFVKSTMSTTDQDLFGISEARLYASTQSLPPEMPECFAVGIEAGGQNVLVLEDLTARGATMNLATTPFSIEQAASGLDGLADLHGRFWNRVREADGLSWIEPFKYDLLASKAGTLNPIVTEGANRLGMTRLIPTALQDPDFLWSWWGRSPQPGPRTLIHGDPHVGNTYAIGDAIGFLDWQLVSEGSWEHDVGYFLIGCLSVEDRRTHERELLERYADRLAKNTDDAPSLDEVWDRYRQTPIYGLIVWLVTATTTTAHSQAVCDECTLRFATAFDDLSTIEFAP